MTVKELFDARRLTLRQAYTAQQEEYLACRGIHAKALSPEEQSQWSEFTLGRQLRADMLQLAQTEMFDLYDYLVDNGVDNSARATWPRAPGTC